MIKNKQFKDLNELKKIKLFNLIIHNNKKYYILPFCKNLKYTRLYLSYNRGYYDKTNTFYSKALHKIAHNNIKYDFSDYWKTKTLDKIIIPSELEELKQLDPFVPARLTEEEQKPRKFTFMKSGNRFKGHTGDILSSFIVIGKNIQKIEISINGNLILTRWYLNAGLINLKPFVDGITLVHMFFASITINVYADLIEHVYAKLLYCNMSDRKRLIDYSAYTSQKYYTYYKSKVRETYLLYCDGLCMPRNV